MATITDSLKGCSIIAVHKIDNNIAGQKPYYELCITGGSSIIITDLQEIAAIDETRKQVKQWNMQGLCINLCDYLWYQIIQEDIFNEFKSNVFDDVVMK